MDKLLSLLLENFGLLPLGLALLFGIIIVWLLAHYTAAPGGSVSVLWGLVKYTKAGSSDKNYTATTASSPLATTEEMPIKSLTMESPSGSLAAVSGDIIVIHAITSETLETILNELRNKCGLHALGVLESGHQLAHTPRGTYFYVSYLWLEKKPDEKVLDLGNVKVDRFRTTPDHFEIHLPQTGDLAVIGFASESDAARIAVPTKEISRLSIAAKPWEKMTSLVSLPAKAIVAGKYRTLYPSEQGRSIEILDLEIQCSSIT